MLGRLSAGFRAVDREYQRIERWSGHVGRVEHDCGYDHVDYVAHDDQLDVDLYNDLEHLNRVPRLRL
jgi:hypothetical protein